ncbi:MAG: redoxin domain-containing protein [Gammaproteobacteria bacterium]
MSVLAASQIVLWVGFIVLALVCIVLTRQIGILHARIAPVGALSLHATLKPGDAAPIFALTALSGVPVQIGGIREFRSQLLLFVSPKCPVCAELLPALRSAAAAERDWLEIVLASDGADAAHQQFVRDKKLENFPYVLSEQLGRSFGVSKLPHAVLIDAGGKLSAAGLINSREHLESLFVAHETHTPSIQDYLAKTARR